MFSQEEKKMLKPLLYTQVPFSSLSLYVFSNHFEGIFNKSLAAVCVYKTHLFNVASNWTTINGSYPRIYIYIIFDIDWAAW